MEEAKVASSMEGFLITPLEESVLLARRMRGRVGGGSTCDPLPSWQQKSTRQASIVSITNDVALLRAFRLNDCNSVFNDNAIMGQWGSS
eukprot:5542567-Amphidinium_carterae.1